MVIQILGSGCPNCKKLEQNAREAVETLGLTAEFQKITESDEILEMGVMRTPGFAIDGEVKKSGRVLSPEEIVETLKEHTA
ncbi:MAG: thioredoxin family protein [Spirochaeta sp.]|nr:thioredoxin family protein [Spirochaeta sp.]